MATPRRTSTPIRQVSSGSFSGVASKSHAQTPLSFLEEEALPILMEETATLHENFAQIADIQQALSTFNESFATFLYGIKMNAFCVEWPEAPTEDDLVRATQRRATTSVSATTTLPVRADTHTEAGDQTYMTDMDESELCPPPRSTSRPSHAAPSHAQAPSRARVPPATTARASTTRRAAASVSQSTSRPPTTRSARPNMSASTSQAPAKRVPPAVQRRRMVRGQIH